MTLREAVRDFLETLDYYLRHEREIPVNALRGPAEALEEALVLDSSGKKFEILRGDGRKKKINGYVVGQFGVHFDQVRNDRCWKVTHIPTGRLCHSGHFSKKAAAMSFAAEVDALVDWSVVTADNATQVVPSDMWEKLRDLRSKYG